MKAVFDTDDRYCIMRSYDCQRREGSFEYISPDSSIASCEDFFHKALDVSYFNYLGRHRGVVRHLNVTNFYNPLYQNLTKSPINFLIYNEEVEFNNHSFEGRVMMFQKTYACEHIITIAGDFRIIIQLTPMFWCSHLLCYPEIPQRLDTITCYSKFTNFTKVEWECRLNETMISLKEAKYGSAPYFKIVFKYIRKITNNSILLSYKYMTPSKWCLGKSYYVDQKKTAFIETFFYVLPERIAPDSKIVVYRKTLNITLVFVIFPLEEKFNYTIDFKIRQRKLKKYVLKHSIIPEPNEVQLLDMHFFKRFHIWFYPTLESYTLEETRILLDLDKGIRLNQSADSPCDVRFLCTRCAINFNYYKTVAFYYNVSMIDLANTIYIYSTVHALNFNETQIYTEIGVNEYTGVINSKTTLKCYRVSFYFRSITDRTVSGRVKNQSIMYYRNTLNHSGVSNIPNMRNMNLKGLKISCKYNISQGPNTKHIVMFHVPNEEIYKTAYVKDDYFQNPINIDFTGSVFCSIVTYTPEMVNEWCQFYLFDSALFHVSDKGYFSKFVQPWLLVYVPQNISFIFEVFYPTVIDVDMILTNPVIPLIKTYYRVDNIPLDNVSFETHNLTNNSRGIFSQFFAHLSSINNPLDEIQMLNYLVYAGGKMFLTPVEDMQHGHHYNCTTNIVDRIFSFQWTCLIGDRYRKLLNNTADLNDNQIDKNEMVYYNLVLVSTQTILIDYSLPPGLYRCRCVTNLTINGTLLGFTNNHFFDLSFFSYINFMGYLPPKFFPWIILVMLLWLLLYLLVFIYLHMLLHYFKYIEWAKHILQHLIVGLVPWIKRENPRYNHWALNEKDDMNILELMECYEEYCIRMTFIQEHIDEIDEAITIQNRMRAYSVMTGNYGIKEIDRDEQDPLLEKVKSNRMKIMQLTLEDLLANAEKGDPMLRPMYLDKRSSKQIIQPVPIIKDPYTKPKRKFNPTVGYDPFNRSKRKKGTLNDLVQRSKDVEPKSRQDRSTIGSYGRRSERNTIGSGAMPFPERNTIGSGTMPRTNRNTIGSSGVAKPDPSQAGVQRGTQSQTFFDRDGRKSIVKGGLEFDPKYQKLSQPDKPVRPVSQTFHGIGDRTAPVSAVNLFKKPQFEKPTYTALGNLAEKSERQRIKPEPKRIDTSHTRRKIKSTIINSDYPSERSERFARGGKPTDPDNARYYMSSSPESLSNISFTKGSSFSDISDSPPKKLHPNRGRPPNRRY